MTEEKNETPILSRLRAPEGAVRRKKRKGRGVGSGLGKTGGRGMKGQTARSPGGFNKLGFEGGQTPLYRRLPKRGFTNINAKTVRTVNVSALARFDAGATVDVAALVECGLVNGGFDSVKILGNGELDKALTIKVDAVSAGAKAKIEAAGGTVELTGAAADAADA